MLVVVAVKPGAAGGAGRAAEEALVAHGAHPLERRLTGRGTQLLFASAEDPAAVVTALRAEGWRATDRPEGGGHLSAWRAHTAPVVVSDRFCVCFPWSEFDAEGMPAPIEVDPGRAFGTGGHPSTHLLLTELARRVAPGDRVLDVGCGSGVLALAAAHLGAVVTATDIAAGALAATAANAAWNGLPVEIGAELPDAAWDAVVANIGAATLIELAPALRARVGPNGWLGLSGLSPGQVSRVAAAYAGDVEERRDGEWAALVIRPSG